MRANILCRERLNRLLSLLSKHSDRMSLRDLWRSHGIWNWEVEQAEELGWVRIATHKPPIGRPSRVAEKLSDSASAKLPPLRRQIPPDISIRHWLFALKSISVVPGEGPFGFHLSTAVQAYQTAYPNARSHAGAAASASRLMRRVDVRAMRLWFRRAWQESPGEAMPTTLNGLLKRLRELGLV